jgi:hypothetical protein
VFVLCLFVFLSLLFFVTSRFFSLYQCLDLLALYTLFTTFTGGPSYWHPCQASIGPHLNLMHYLRILSFLINFY